jgi:hypothetical protein
MRLFFRVMFMLAMIAVEKACGNVGYLAGFAWKSLKEGHGDGRIDCQYRRHREFVRFNAPIVKAKFGNILKKPQS